VGANLKANRINAVLFDVDDTLLDSYRARVQALQDVITEAGSQDIKAEKFLSDLQGAPFQDALNQLAVERDNKDDLFINYRHTYWIEQSGNIRLFPGIKIMLASLKSRGYKIGIVTSKLRDSIFEGKHIGCTYELMKAGIADMFSVIIGLEDVSNCKPHPEGINLAISKLGSQPQDTLFVGDSAADIEAALSAGCLSCHARWGVKDTSNLPENLRADYVIKKPQALLKLECL
jgi:pyrophosphatase PpaX